MNSSHDLACTWIREAHLRPATLAKKLGVSPQRAQQIIAGPKQPGINLMKRIADACGVAPERMRRELLQLLELDHDHGHSREIQGSATDGLSTRTGVGGQPENAP